MEINLKYNWILVVVCCHSIGKQKKSDTFHSNSDTEKFIEIDSMKTKTKKNNWNLNNCDLSLLFFFHLLFKFHLIATAIFVSRDNGGKQTKGKK